MTPRRYVVRLARGVLCWLGFHEKYDCQTGWVTHCRHCRWREIHR